MTRVARALLIVYVVVLALIAFWPTPVDRDAGPILRAITSAVPWLTYARIEFAANIALFVPFGWCAALGWPRWQAYVIPAGLVISLAIEAAQGVLLAERTASVWDVVANTLGAAAGWLIARRWTVGRDQPASGG
ncbi:VanZ family protein [Microbacterium sp. 2P01SA-2]|uniref:VanZ family protein n=1 Tax=unclassified Microbacterium TaxID=2609290 RepID=UPI0039A2C667